MWILMLPVQSCIAIRWDLTVWLRAEVMHINDSWMADFGSIWCSPMTITKFIPSLHPQGRKSSPISGRIPPVIKYKWHSFVFIWSHLVVKCPYCTTWLYDDCFHCVPHHYLKTYSTLEWQYIIMFLWGLQLPSKQLTVTLTHTASIICIRGTSSGVPTLILTLA